jgi:hypothetical protein
MPLFAAVCSKCRGMISLYKLGLYGLAYILGVYGITYFRAGRAD